MVAILVVVDIHTRPVALNWKCPQPRVPQCLRVPARDLQKCERWKDLTGAVRDSSAAMQLAALPPDASPQAISSLLANALQVVKSAGGLESRVADRCPAFESTNVRRARNTAASLGKCSALVCGEQGVGFFSHALLAHLERIRKHGLRPPSSSRSAPADWVSVELASARRKLQEALQEMRTVRANKEVERPSPKTMA